jgi:hypothetical protein
MSAPGPYNPNPQPPRSGGGLSVLMIILIVAGVLLLLCAGICGGCVLVAQRTATEFGSALELLPVQMAASSAVEGDPAVIEKLGEPIEQSSPPARQGSGEIKPAGETFTFDISGPNGTGKVTATAMKDAGAWKVTVITVQCSDGTTLNVPPPPAAGPDVQFDMPDMPEDAAAPSDSASSGEK